MWQPKLHKPSPRHHTIWIGAIETIPQWIRCMAAKFFPYWTLFNHDFTMILYIYISIYNMSIIKKYYIIKTYSWFSLRHPSGILLYSWFIYDTSIKTYIASIFYRFSHMFRWFSASEKVLTLDGNFLLAVWHEKYVDLQETSPHQIHLGCIDFGW